MTKTEVQLIEREVLHNVHVECWCAGVSNQRIKKIRDIIRDIFAKHGVMFDD